MQQVSAPFFISINNDNFLNNTLFKDIHLSQKLSINYNRYIMLNLENLVIYYFITSTSYQNDVLINI